MQDRFKFRFWNGRGIIYDDLPHLELYNCEDYIWMQCTGLKDKSGNLIYEGDIVTDGYHNMEVYYNQIDCRFILKKVTKYIIKRFGKGSFEYCYLMDRTEENKCKDHLYKVIGNIYENPELLEDNK